LPLTRRIEGCELRMKYWEIIADNLKKAGWSLGWVSALDCEGRTIWIADAHRDDGKRFVVRSDEELTAFFQLESAIRRNLAALAAKTSNGNHPSKGNGSHKVEKPCFARFLWNLVSQSPENDNEKQRGLTFYTWTV
jgi:hypothetical protein